MKTSQRVILAQFWTLDEAPDLACMLAFPHGPMRPKAAGARLSLFSEHRQIQKCGKDVGRAIAELAKRKLNGVRVDWQFEPFFVPSLRARLEKIVSLLKVSPRSVHWSPAGGPPAANSTFAEFQSVESMVGFHSVAHYPTLVEVYLTFGDAAAGWADDLLSTFAESIPPALLPMPVLGGVDVLDALPEVVIPLDCDVAPWPMDFQLLGTRFDRLHELMLGPPSTCLPMCAILGESASHKILRRDEGQGSLKALVQVKRSLLGDQCRHETTKILMYNRSLQAKLQPFLLERNWERSLARRPIHDEEFLAVVAKRTSASANVILAVRTALAKMWGYSRDIISPWEGYLTLWPWESDAVRRFSMYFCEQLGGGVDAEELARHLRPPRAADVADLINCVQLALDGLQRPS